MIRDNPANSASSSSCGLEVENLTKLYPPVRKGLVGFRDLVDTLKGKREEVLALRDISFDVSGGEWFGLLGPNGSGKTTLCNIILDVTTPTSGHVRYDGFDVNREHEKIQGRICTMQYQFLLQRVNVRDSLRRAGAEWMLPREEIEERMNWLVDIFDMREKLDDWLVRLSSGMFRKVMMIATLMSGAELLVFDEPTQGMDVFTRKKLYEQLHRFQRESGTTVFWTTHNLQEAEETCDRIAVIDNHLVTVTTPKKLVHEMEKANLEEAFITLLRGNKTQNGNMEGSGSK